MQVAVNMMGVWNVPYVLWLQRFWLVFVLALPIRSTISFILGDKTPSLYLGRFYSTRYSGTARAAEQPEGFHT
jgi:hypothetical protein